MSGHEWLAAAPLVSVAFALLIWRLRRRYSVVTVTGDSMRPALVPGVRLLVRRMPLARVRAGDIVVVVPHRHGIDRASDELPWMVKRAVAVPGDPVPAAVASVVSAVPGSPVPDGMLIICGDNAAVSYDSRQCGYFSADQLFGVALRSITPGTTGRHPRMVPEVDHVQPVARLVECAGVGRRNNAR